MVKKLLPFIILTGLILIFFWRLFFPTLSLFMIPDFGESDVLHLNLPFKHILSTSLKNKEWPLWTPYLASGFPLLAEGQIGTFYLPNLLFFRFLPLVWGYNLNLVLSYLLASLGTYLFARKLGFSLIASFFAGFIFTFSGFLAVHLNHFNLVQAASLLPLIFWSALALWEKPKFKYSILAAFFISQQIFTGHFYIVFITCIGLVLFLLGKILFEKRDNLRKNLVFICLSFVIAFLFSAIQLLPTIELWQLSARQSGLDFDTVTQYPYPINNLITFIKPYAFGNPANGSYPPFNSDWGIFWENTAYVGLLPLLLVCISIFFLKNQIVKTFLVILFVSLLLVLGKNSPLYFIFTFPPFNFFRVPSKFLLLVTFSLAILAAYVFNQILTFIRRSKTSSFTQMQAIAFICVSMFFFSLMIDEYRFSYNYPPATPAKWWMDKPEIIDLFTPQAAKISSPLAPYSWNQVFGKSGWQDFQPFIFFRNSLYPNYNAQFGVASSDINTGGLIPRRISLFTSLTKNLDAEEPNKEATMSATALNALSIAGVTHLISPYRINHKGLLFKSKFTAPDSLKIEPFFIYQNNNALPRSYLVFRSEKLDTLEDFYKQLADDNFLNEQKALVEDDDLKINQQGKTIQKVAITSEKSERITFSGTSDSDAILVLTDTYYPGWTAYIDDLPTKIYNVNFTQRGIFFPKGNHDIKFIFHSVSFELGKKITVFSLFIISAVVSLYSFVLPHKASASKKP